MTAAARLARSLLFVPGDRPERFDKAAASGADAVILDLEDAVGTSAKGSARQAILDWLPGHHGNGVWVRINAVGSAAHDDDVAFLKRLSAALAGAGIADAVRIMLPKVESRASVDALAGSVGHGQGLEIIAQIESALGLDQARDFAQSASITRLAFGSIDYSLDLGLAPDEDLALLHARSHLVWVSRLAELPAPIDTVTVNLKDASVIEHDARLARRLGFGGKLCIHPSQVTAVNAAFSPSEKDIAWAHEVVRVSHAAGDGAVKLGDQMIDKPVLLRAQRILASI